MDNTFGENLANALNSDMSDAMFKTCMEIMQENIEHAFLYGSQSALRYQHIIPDDPRIIAAYNHGMTVSILFGFSDSHTVGSATISMHESEPDVMYFNMTLPPHQGSRESMHLKLYRGLERKALKPVVVVAHGIVMYIALAHPAFESDVIDINEAEEIYAPMKRGYE